MSDETVQAAHAYECWAGRGGDDPKDQTPCRTECSCSCHRAAKPVVKRPKRLRMDPKTGATVLMPKATKRERRQSPMTNAPTAAAARKAAKVADRMPPKSSAKVAKPKAAKPKAEPVERVPAAEVERFVKDLGITKTQLAQAAGVSTSLIAEWTGRTGKRPGRLLAASRWPEVQASARALVAALPQPEEATA